MKKEEQKIILDKLGIEVLNPMQLAAIETVGNHLDTLLFSPTGSGKTLAFLLPLMEHLNPKGKQVQAMVLTPSRELAIQIEQVWKKMATGFKIICAYGGHDMPSEMQSLVEAPALLVGTPGRIADHLKRRSFDASAIRILVFDEFDKSLALGFEEDMTYITKSLKPKIQKIFVSATEAIEIPEFIKPEQLEVLDFLNTSDSTADIRIHKVVSEDKDKVDTLVQLLSHLGNEQALIFCNHREAVERTGQLLNEKGIPNTVFHGGMEQMQREQALIKFRNGTAMYLIATDLAARGLDIPDINHIIHYHLPSTLAEFTHRNGRTARMNASGEIYLLVHADEQLPRYIDAEPDTLQLKKAPLPATSSWSTVYINGGKKDKINKVDIVGLFMQKGNLTKEELGLIVVKDQNSFVAVKKNKLQQLLRGVQPEKIKGKKFLIMEAK
jgi:superfamily II DNA/RNA helicase